MKRTLTLLSISLFCLPLIAQLQLTTKELQVGNMLTWTTPSYEGNCNFVIMRAETGKDYTTIGEIPAPAANKETSMRFLDAATGISSATYKVVAHLDDNKNWSSNEMVVVRASANNLVITKMSNTDAESTFDVSIESVKAISVTCTMTDVNKVNVFASTQDLKQGNNDIHFDLTALPIGRYHVVINHGTEKEEITVRHIEPRSTIKAPFVRSN